ncbi:MAG: hypothetical protein ACI8Q3_002412, partial [Marinomonas primoryensis]
PLFKINIYSTIYNKFHKFPLKRSQEIGICSNLTSNVS